MRLTERLPWNLKMTMTVTANTSVSPSLNFLTFFLLLPVNEVDPREESKHENKVMENVEQCYNNKVAAKNFLVKENRNVSILIRIVGSDE
jgi:hypothetical protein